MKPFMNISISAT